MSTFNLMPTDLKVPCQSFQCHERAAYFLGKENAPRGTEYIICEKCANELIQNIMNSVAFVKNPAFVDGFTINAGIINADIINAELPFEDKPDMFLGKKVSDWGIDELKELAKKKNLTGYSKKNKAELITMIEEAEG